MQPQQRQEWSEYDKMMFASIMNVPGLDEQQKEWLATCNPRPKQEWSEKDKEYINDLTAYFDGCSLQHVTSDIILWLESLKDRYTWKPSEEQMRVLDLAIRCGINRGTTEESTLVLLFNDLKKLK